MANNIEKFKKYIDLLDEVYKQSSKTQDLDGDTALVRAGANANEIIVPKISMDGLADYSRNSGYVNGDVNFTYETVPFNYDRGRAFTIDAMDNEETAGLAFGKLSSEFLRTKVVPEVDAFRFATYAGVEGIGSATGTLADGNAALTALVNATSEMDDAEVNEEGRILYITSTLYNQIMNVDTYKSKEVMDGFAKVVKVPQSRFYTAIELMDGTSEDELVGGYKKAADGKDINFMIIERSALLQYPKHKVNKVVTPEQNQTSDGWKFFYREYGLADVYENKTAGIYVHHKA